jgi:hypothetical protein
MLGAYGWVEAASGRKVRSVRLADAVAAIHALF